MVPSESVPEKAPYPQQLQTRQTKTLENVNFMFCSHFPGKGKNKLKMQLFFPIIFPQKLKKCPRGIEGFSLAWSWFKVGTKLARNVKKSMHAFMHTAQMWGYPRAGYEPEHVSFRQYLKIDPFRTCTSAASERTDSVPRKRKHFK